MLRRRKSAERFCIENNIKILGKIPFDTDLGALNSDAKIVAYEEKKYKDMFSSLLDRVVGEVKHATVTDIKR